MSGGDQQEKQIKEAARRGLLLARPGSPTKAGRPGLQRLVLDSQGQAALYVPTKYEASRPAPLMLVLHGATGTGVHAIQRLAKLADEAGLILLAPDAQGRSWDRIHGGYGPDVALIDQALEQVFEQYAVDPSHVAIEGFSDGASYALSLGITNGDLFTHVIAFSPGMLVPAGQRGQPRIYISHGTDDQMLPIDYCSRRMLPILAGAGYRVVYQEFEGGHQLPEEIAEDALGWFLEQPAPEPT